MSSEEEDYMSEAFLNGCVQEDVRPGLVHNRAVKRRYELDKKKSEKHDANKKEHKRIHVVEQELREDALKQPISEDNKGFKMLQRLGFKPGSGLGKSQEGCKEPIPINVKCDRQGLGRMQAIKEIMERKAAIMKERQNKSQNVTEYRSRLAEIAAEKRAEIDFRKCQKVCQQLDSEKDYEPFEYWYWPVSKSKDDDNDKNDDDDYSQPEAKQARIHEDNDEEMDVTNENHHNDDDDDEEEEEEEDENHEDNYTVHEKLEMLTAYLRQTHYYCIWCGTQYNDEQDMNDECPGPTYDEH